MYKLLLLRYGELGLKGKNKGQFIKRLVNNINKAIPDKKVMTTYGRLWLSIEDDLEDTIDKLKNVFGLYSVSPVIRTGRELDDMASAAVTILRDSIDDGGTFKVETKRPDKTYPIKSPEISRRVGGIILEKVGEQYKVDVHNPDIRIDVEVRNEGVFVYGKTILMGGGLPVGSSGKAVLMLSGGIDSPVAAYLAMKRGVTLEAVHFHSFPYTSERAKEKVIDLCRVLAGYTGNIKLHIVHFTDIQMELRKQCKEEYTITMMRRMMYRLAERIAQKEGALAIFTGESVGQVASQTLESMMVINETIKMPVLRPLCGMDKEEIIKMSKAIGTFDISIEPYEDCCTIFLPKYPKIKPKLDEAITMEKDIDIEGLINDALKKTVTLNIKRED